MRNQSSAHSNPSSPIWTMHVQHRFAGTIRLQTINGVFNAWPHETAHSLRWASQCVSTFLALNQGRSAMRVLSHNKDVALLPMSGVPLKKKKKKSGTASATSCSRISRNRQNRAFLPVFLEHLCVNSVQEENPDEPSNKVNFGPARHHLLEFFVLNNVYAMY